MDLFGWKAKRALEELTIAHDMLWAQSEQAHENIEHLRSQLRDYDGRLCAAMQQPTAQAIVEALRPLFLVAEARQRQHSDQLGMAMIQNMKENSDRYVDPPTQKAITHGL